MLNLTREILKRKVYLDYPFESVMGRTVPPTKSRENPKHFIKFYGDEEINVSATHLMMLEVEMCGEEITKEQYEKGKNADA